MKPLLESLESRSLPSATVMHPPFGPGATVQTGHGHYGELSLAAGAAAPVDFRQAGYVPLAEKLYTPEAGAVLSPDQRAVYEEQWYVPIVEPMTDAIQSMIGPETQVYGYPMRQTQNIQEGIPRDTPPAGEGVSANQTTFVPDALAVDTLLALED